MISTIGIHIPSAKSKESREKLYAKCKAKGLQLIATRVTDSNVMEVTDLDDDEG